MYTVSVLMCLTLCTFLQFLILSGILRWCVWIGLYSSSSLLFFSNQGSNWIFQHRLVTNITKIFFHFPFASLHISFCTVTLSVHGALLNALFCASMTTVRLIRISMMICAELQRICLMWVERISWSCNETVQDYIMVWVEAKRVCWLL